MAGDRDEGIRLKSTQGNVRFKTDADRAREAKVPQRPGPLQEGKPGQFSNVITLPGIEIKLEQGVASFRRDGRAIFDFSGRDSSRDPAPEGFDPANFNANLALMPGVPLAQIATRLLELDDAHERERAEWTEIGEKGAKLLGVQWEEPSAQPGPEGFISKIHHPFLMRATMTSWANARAELLPATGPVKVRDDQPELADWHPNPPNPANGSGPGIAAGMGHNGGPPMEEPQGPSREQLANALEIDFNHQLTQVDKEYYTDTSKMLFHRALKGSQFKHVFYDPLLKRPVSRWVKGTNLVVGSFGATHLSGCGMYCEHQEVRQSVVKRMQKAGAWRKIDLGLPPPEASSVQIGERAMEGIKAVPSLPADYVHQIRVCYVELDDGPLGRDETGADSELCLPYKVVIDKHSREVLEIRRDWKKGDKDYKRRRHYVHYGFMPGLGFYSWGYLHVLGSPERAATAMLREFIDAEMLASMPAGLVQKGPQSRGDTTEFRLGPGQWKVVETGGVPLAEFAQPLPYKGASPGLVAALQHVVQEASKLAGALEVPMGEGRVGDVPVQTIMAYIDAISKVPSAIHKDDHMAQSEEFELLRELYVEYPDSFVSTVGKQWTEQELNDAELVPAADPNTPSQVHRIMRTAAKVQMSGLPQFMGVANPRKIFEDALRTLGESRPEDSMLPVQPQGQQPPDPKAMAMLAKTQVDQGKLQLEGQKLQQKGQENQREAAAQALEAEQRDKDRQSEHELEEMRIEAEREKLGHENAHANADRDLAAQDQAMAHHREVGGLVAENERHTRELQQADLHHREEMAHEKGLAVHEAAAAKEQAKAAATAKPKPAGKAKKAKSEKKDG